MKKLIHLAKEEQQIMPLFDGAFVENKPIPFPDKIGTKAYSNLFYWANLVANETSEFPLHPHQGFEIMTFVFKGSIEHYDTATDIWTPLNGGDVQVIQAGSGVKHAEKITKGSQLFQIWFDPDFSKTISKDAQYRDYKESQFIPKIKNGIERLLYVGDNGVIDNITPDITIEKLTFIKGEYQEELDDRYTYSYYLLDGEMKINNQVMIKDSFLVLNDTSRADFSLSNRAELFIIKSRTKIDYHLFIERYI